MDRVYNIFQVNLHPDCDEDPQYVYSVRGTDNQVYQLKTLLNEMCSEYVRIEIEPSSLEDTEGDCGYCGTCGCCDKITEEIANASLEDDDLPCIACGGIGCGGGCCQ